jgi:hypothetical protein
MHCYSIAWNISFDTGVTSAKGNRLECFKWAVNKNQANPLCSKIMLIFDLTQVLYVYAANSMTVMYVALLLVQLL